MPMAWGADMGLGGGLTTAAPMPTLLDRTGMVCTTGVAKHYRDRYLDGVTSGWVSKAESLDSFTPLQLDTFYALSNLYDPSSERSHPAAREEGERRLPTLSRVESLRRFSIGTKVIKPVEGGEGRVTRPGQVYGVYSPYWRIRFGDDNLEELTASEMRRFRV